MDIPSTPASLGRLHSRFRPILFRRAASTTSSLRHSNLVVSDDDVVGSTNSRAGQEAKEFYESLISSTDTLPQDDTKSSNASHKESYSHKRRKIDKRCERKLKHSTQKADKTHPLSQTQHAKLVNSLLQGAQNGDINKVKDALKQGCDINSIDDFSWSAIMCASHSGKIDIVKYLLKRGAVWVNHFDQKGRTALDLAKTAGHMHVYDLLKSYSQDRHETVPSSSSTSSMQSPAGYTCEICKLDFKETLQAEHASSTLHLFNCQHKPQSTHYHIPDGNIGFKLLLKDGWDKEKGLGPDGKGLKFPVKTILKRDRQGLGANPDDPQSKPRVTHFQPHDVAAVKKPKKDPTEKKMRANTLSRKSRQKKDMKERAWEIDFRQSFNTLDY